MFQNSLISHLEISSPDFKDFKLEGLRDLATGKLCVVLSYTIYGKTFEGENFAVVYETHYSLENFRGASGPCHYVLYTASDSRGKLSRLAKNHESFAVYGNRSPESF